jgi:hypothetical protein
LTSLALGIALGLLIAWVLLPVQFTNADPADLRQSAKDDYVRMISAAYHVDGDLATARLRLKQLGVTNPTLAINDLISRTSATPSAAASLGALSNLQLALNVKADSVAQQPTLKPGQTPQAVIIVTTPTEPVASFTLVEHTQLSCTDEPDAPHLRFIVRDANGHDLPNVAIQIRSAAGDDTVYTGLKPERGVGYADFEATPGTFSVTLLNAQSDTVSDLLIGDAPANCRTDRGATPRGWKLVFQQQ